MRTRLRRVSSVDHEVYPDESNKVPLSGKQKRDDEERNESVLT